MLKMMRSMTPSYWQRPGPGAVSVHTLTAIHFGDSPHAAKSTSPCLNDKISACKKLQNRVLAYTISPPQNLFIHLKQKNSPLRFNSQRPIIYD